jgi:hypothetical protein
MIWKMDPFQMPKWFCLAQTIVIAFGAFLLTGVCTTLAVATTRAVYRPSEIRDFRTLGWRPSYWLILGVFPACASAVQITVLIKFDATKPSDDLHCDASNPMWSVILSLTTKVATVLICPSFSGPGFSAMREFPCWRSCLASS